MPKVARLKKSRNRRKKAGTKKRIHRHTRKYMHGGDITKYCWNGFFPASAAWEENMPISIWCKAESEEEARQKLYTLFDYFTNNILPLINEQNAVGKMSAASANISDPSRIFNEIQAAYTNADTIIKNFPDATNLLKDLFVFNPYENRVTEQFVGIDTANTDMEKYDLCKSTLLVENNSDPHKISIGKLLVTTKPIAC